MCETHTNPAPAGKMAVKGTKKNYSQFKMQETYIQDKTFVRSDFAENSPIKGGYENCIFNNCLFTGKDFSGFKFVDCAFNACDLSQVKLNGAVLRDTKFNDCKMLGLRFDTCSGFGFSCSFDKCTLDYSVFFRTKVKNTVFKDSSLQETDFTESDLTGALFDNCNLIRTVFNNTILEKADFRTSFHYSIHPETNRIKKAKFSISGISGLLDRYDIEIEQ